MGYPIKEKIRLKIVFYNLTGWQTSTKVAFSKTNIHPYFAIPILE